MPKVTHVKKARKAIPEAGIAVGESYYHWSFMSGGRGGPKQVSKTPPKPSQLTQSEFWGAVYALQEDDATPEFDDLESAIETMKSELENIRDACQEKFDNLPEGFQNGSGGELQQGRIDACEEAINTLESIDTTYDGEDKEEDRLNWRDEQWQEAIEAVNNISCD